MTPPRPRSRSPSTAASRAATARPRDSAPYVEPPPLTPEQEKEAFGDAPDAGLLLEKRKEHAREHVSQIGEATLRNAARLAERDLDGLPSTASAAREWLHQHAVPVFNDKRR